VKMSTVESIARPRRNGERRRAPTASISKESPAITGVVEMVIRRPICLHCIQMDTSVNAANQVVSVGADIAFDADPKFFACLVRFESSSVPTTLPTAYDVYPLDGRHDGGYYTVKDCVTIDVLPRTPGNNVYVGFMVWSNFTATKCRGL